MVFTILSELFDCFLSMMLKNSLNEFNMFCDQIFFLNKRFELCSWIMPLFSNIISFTFFLSPIIAILSFYHPSFTTSVKNTFSGTRVF